MFGDPSTRPRSRDIAIGGALVAALLWILALAVAPRWHESVHHDSNGSRHECAVTLLRSGVWDSTPVPDLAIGIGAAWGREEAIPHVAWVPSVFLTGGVFEHAPPFCV
jgi:hypothetical protein